MNNNRETWQHINAERAQVRAHAKLELNGHDLQKLVSHPDRNVRATLTQKVCRQINMIELSEHEQAVVGEILRLISKDAAAIVRRALAITLKNSPHLPRDIALKLIRDVDSIAVPVLTYSPVLSDEDLVEILKSKASAKMMAITKRTRIAGDLVRAMIRYGDSQIIASVAANDGAQINETLGVHMLDLYHDNDLIKESFIARRDLPALMVEKLIGMVSAETVIRMNELHDIPMEIAMDIAKRTRERAQIDFISQSWVNHDLRHMVSRLAQEDRLTHQLITRAACCGQMRFVEQAMAQKSGAGLQKTCLMLHDSGPFGLKALCKQAGFDGLEFTLIRASVAIFKDLESSGTILDKTTHQTRMLERVLSLPIEFNQDDMAYLLEKLDACEANLSDFTPVQQAV